MRAVQLQSHGGGPVLNECPSPEPAAGEVAVEIAYCAVAVGDLLVSSGARQEYHGTADSFSYPHTLGFQGVGTIAGVGAGVPHDRLGEQVTINGVLGCGECDQCRRGAENRCREHALLGLDSGYPGCLAEQVCVPAQNTHRWPEHLSPTLAPFVSELGTMAHVIRRIRCGPGEQLAVVGAGQTGVFGAAAGRIAGADRVISIDIDPQRLEFARRLGADVTADAREADPVATVRALTGDSVSRAIEVVGASQTVVQTIRMFAPHGVTALVGTGRGIALDLPDYERVIGGEVSLLGCLGKTNGEYALALSWIAEKRVDPSFLPVEIYPLAGFEDAWRAAERPGGARVLIDIKAGA